MNVRGIGRLQQAVRRVTNMFVPHAMILLYHRVADLPQDPQLLCVSPSHFAEHLAVLRKWGQPLHVSSLGHALESGKRRSIIIVTFDDGYADNLYNAKPLLEHYDVPATVFVTTGYVGATREFWYDDLERIFLRGGPLPETLRLKVNERSYQWELGSTANGGEEAYGFPGDWNVTRRDDPTVRHTIYRSLYQILQPLPDTERQKVLEDVARWSGMDTLARPSHRALSPKELIQLANGGLIEIGAHTVSHPMLSAIPLPQQADEISRSKAHLEELLDDRVSSFAYPFGGRSHYTTETATAVRDAGFESACSNFAGIISPDTDRWQLPRFLVRDWDGDEFARNLRGWLDA